MAEITPSIDLAQVVLYLFWIFFACVVYYLLRENKREGYPLVTDRYGDRVKVQGWPAIPDPKTYKLAGGATFTAPNGSSDTRGIAAEPLAGHPGSPLAPTGNPMLSGVGPGAYAERADVPERALDGSPMIVPLRVATDHHLDSRDPDPRGLPVVGGDGAVGGTVVDAWVDRAEALIRYLEVEVAGGTKRVLLPVNFSRITKRSVQVRSIYAAHFTNVPALRNADSVTKLEEEKITAYYGAGTLYADPARQEPLL